jgi:uncharacterized membrane protein YgdD (TMEM256/DUF423 family)
MSRALMICAALSGLMAVAAGAFGAHAVADAQAKAWLQTGGHYQLVHAVAAVACAALAGRLGRACTAAGWLFLAGGLVFGGSLYLMAMGGPRAFGAATPVGGLLLMLGWGVLAFAAVRSRRDQV